MTDFDPSALDVQSTPHIIPDHTASDKDNRPSLGRFLRGDGKDTKSRNTRTSRARTHVPTSKPGEFVQPIADFYRLLAAIALPFDPHCASVILQEDDRQFLNTEGTIENPSYKKDRAQLCAEALDEAAQKSEGLRRTLQFLTTGGTWGKVIAAHAPIGLAIAAHHTPFMEKFTAWQMQRMQDSMERAGQNGNNA